MNKTSAIHIHVSDHVFTFTPTSCYHVDATDYVFMYHLAHEFPDKTRVETHIPYYISDGKTNRLYADMLYPFMCFNTTQIDPPVCPISMDKGLSEHGLIKYQITKNINNRILSQKIERMYPDQTRLGAFGGPLNGIDWLTNGGRSANLGITTIFRRIENILDFMICVSKEKIHTYRPMSYAEFNDSKESERFTPPVSDPDNKKWNDQHRAPYPSYENMYRWCVLEILHDMIQQLQVTRVGESVPVAAAADAQANPVSISYIEHELPITSVSYDAFNEIINVCNEQPAHQSKLAIYKKISTDLYEALHALPQYRTFPFFDSVEDTKEPELDHTLRLWNASCLSTLDYRLQEISKLDPNLIFRYIIANGRIMKHVIAEQVIKIDQHFLLKIKEYVDTKRAELTDGVLLDVIDKIEQLGQRRAGYDRNPYITDHLYTMLIEFAEHLFSEWVSKKSPQEALQFIKTVDSLKHISVFLKDKLAVKTEEFVGRFQKDSSEAVNAMAAVASVDVTEAPMGDFMGLKRDTKSKKLKKLKGKKKLKSRLFSKKR